MRGEHVDFRIIFVAGEGSSPHARGARIACKGCRGSFGIIPACAGSTIQTHLSDIPREDHPRMRGEHTFSFERGVSGEGSSPHARGARGARHHRQVRRGIIPACAGSTENLKSQFDIDVDHPRMRGEHHLNGVWQRLYLGSSPHARGAQAGFPLLPGSPGIIPACAGSTRAERARRCSTRDHPRMRGEHHTESANPYPSRGSSPHARGARSVEMHTVVAHGIIPACAGSTAYVIHYSFLSRDHPRMRGEHE